MPFFDKNRDKAKYVLISFSRNLTTRRLDSSITHLRHDTRGLPGKDECRPRHTTNTFKLPRAPSPGPTGLRRRNNGSEPPGQSLNTADKNENDNDEENETYASSRDIAPLPAVRPPRQRTHESQDQK